MSATARAIAGLVLLALLPAADAGTHEASQVAAIKAAFVLNFLKFTDWPPSNPAAPSGELILAVVGEEPLAEQMRANLEGKQVQNRRLRVVAWSDPLAWLAQAETTDALFVTAAARDDWPTLRAALAGRPMVTIANHPGFCATGGMLNLFEQSGRLRFEANPAAARSAGLRLRSDLLSLAILIETERTTQP